MFILVMSDTILPYSLYVNTSPAGMRKGSFFLSVKRNMYEHRRLEYALKFRERRLDCRHTAS